MQIFPTNENCGQACQSVRLLWTQLRLPSHSWGVSPCDSSQAASLLGPQLHLGGPVTRFNQTNAAATAALASALGLVTWTCELLGALTVPGNSCQNQQIQCHPCSLLDRVSGRGKGPVMPLRGFKCSTWGHVLCWDSWRCLVPEVPLYPAKEQLPKAGGGPFGVALSGWSM